jgi:hypothetical protein
MSNLFYRTHGGDSSTEDSTTLQHNVMMTVMLNVYLTYRLSYDGIFAVLKAKCATGLPINGMLHQRLHICTSTLQKSKCKI